MNSECKCQQAVDLIKAVARDGIVHELQFQLAQRDALAKRIELLLGDFAVATNGTR